MNLKSIILNARMNSDYQADNRPYIFADNGKLYRTHKVPKTIHNYRSFGVEQLSSMSVETLEMELEELNEYNLRGIEIDK